MGWGAGGEGNFWVNLSQFLIIVNTNERQNCYYRKFLNWFKMSIWIEIVLCLSIHRMKNMSSLFAFHYFNSMFNCSIKSNVQIPPLPIMKMTLKKITKPLCWRVTPLCELFPLFLVFQWQPAHSTMAAASAPELLESVRFLHFQSLD